MTANALTAREMVRREITGLAVSAFSAGYWLAIGMIYAAKGNWLASIFLGSALASVSAAVIIGRRMRRNLDAA
jgi:hypothetical protein